PLVAVVSFVCSVGNIPLAAVLWNGGISFGGVIAFIFADLIVLPVLDIYRKYYGWKMAGFLFATFYAAMAGAALIVEAIFGAAGRTPRLYSPGMLRLLRSRCAGWTSAMVLSFSVAMLAFSVSGMGVTHAFAGSLHAEAASGSAAHAAPAHPCDRCGGGDHDMSVPACSAVCAGAVAVLSTPALPASVEI